MGNPEKKDNDNQAKEVAFYSANLNAWINTRFERDKQLLGLSATAIGLLVTLLRTTAISNNLQLFLYGFALIAFLITVISVVWIFSENAKYLEKVIGVNTTESETTKDTENETTKDTRSKRLNNLDICANFSFILGIILVVIIGIQFAFINFKSMEETSNLNQHRTEVKNDSIYGIHKFRPEKSEKPKPPQSSQSDNSQKEPSNNQTNTSNKS